MKILTGVLLFIMTFITVSTFGLAGGPVYKEAMFTIGPIFILNAIGFILISKRKDIVHISSERKTYRIMGTVLLVLGVGFVLTYLSSKELSSIVFGIVMLSWGGGLRSMNPAEHRLLGS